MLFLKLPVVIAYPVRPVVSNIANVAVIAIAIAIAIATASGSDSQALLVSVSMAIAGPSLGCAIRLSILSLDLRVVVVDLLTPIAAVIAIVIEIVIAIAIVIALLVAPLVGHLLGLHHLPAPVSVGVVKGDRLPLPLAFTAIEGIVMAIGVVNADLSPAVLLDLDVVIVAIDAEDCLRSPPDSNAVVVSIDAEFTLAILEDEARVVAVDREQHLARLDCDGVVVA